MFGWVLWIAVPAVGVGLAHRRFRLESDPRAGDGLKAFLGWLRGRFSAGAAGGWRARAADFYRFRISSPYPGFWKWAAVSLGGSFLFLAAGGLGFAAFGVRLQGYPLMAHVAAGGLFALSLVVVLARRARAFSPAVAGQKGPPSAVWFFWLFMLSGWTLLVTALAMMLPISSFHAQLNLFALHRWAALAAVLSAMVFLEVSAPRVSRDG